MTKKDGALTLQGTARKIGENYGVLTKTVIKQDIQDFFIQAKTKKISIKELKNKNSRFIDIIQDIAPYWLEEAEGVALSTGIDLESYLIYNSLMPLRWAWCGRKKPVDHCTSCLAVGKATKTGNSLLLKNRDFAAFIQTVYIKHFEGKLKYIGSGCVSSMGIAHFLNEKGLAGASNTGSKIKEFIPIELTANQLLRLIAEQAGNCEEALEIAQNIIIKKKIFISDRDLGSILLFVDKDKGLIVEIAGQNLAYEFIIDTYAARSNHFIFPSMQHTIDKEKERMRIASPLHRYNRANEMMQKASGKIDVELFKKISRDTKGYPESIGRVTTRLSFIHIVEKKDAKIFSKCFVADGHPRSVPFIPLYMGINSIRNDLVSGLLWQNVQAEIDQRGIPLNLPKNIIQFESMVQQQLKELEKIISCESSSRIIIDRLNIICNEISTKLAKMWIK